jgi:hypothetical protein
LALPAGGLGHPVRARGRDRRSPQGSSRSRGGGVDVHRIRSIRSRGPHLSASARTTRIARFTPLIVGCLALAGAAAVALRNGVARPAYHDELAYLLAADTFAHGRLANPPHPLWQHFESFHILQQPTYASKYPPGQGLVLALGQVLWAPIAGVWIGAAAMCAAITWMLRAWVSPRWALFGGLLTAVQIGLLSYWSQSYWGGAVSAFGGAVVFGALPRIVRRSAVEVAVGPPIVLGLGLLLLANTRPFEGALVSLAAAVPLLGWLWRGSSSRGARSSVAVAATRRGDRGARWARVVTPLAIVLALGLAAMGWYNRAVTGSPLRVPYSAHNEQYLVQPLFVLQPLRPVPEYRHDILRRYFAEFEVREFDSQRTLSGWASTRIRRLERSRAILLGPVLTASLLVLPWSRRMRGMRIALGGVGLLLVSVAITTHHYPHYAGPAFALLVLIVVQGWRLIVIALARRLGRRRAGRRSAARRRDLLGAAVLAAAVVARIAIADPVLRVGVSRSSNRAKAEVERHLEELGGRHLVFVRHGRYADIHDEWVANGADIDAGRIVWARAMTPEQDDELVRYYPDRRAWRVAIAVDRPGVIDFNPNPAVR